jgi:hypothetical protein
LGERDIPPFNDERGRLEKEPRPKLDWTKVPESLQSLTSAAERYGELRSYPKMDDFLSKLDREEARRLVAVRELCNKKEKAIFEYVDAHDWSECPEAAQFYYMMMFMDHNGVRYLDPDKDEFAEDAGEK